MPSSIHARIWSRSTSISRVSLWHECTRTESSSTVHGTRRGRGLAPFAAVTRASLAPEVGVSSNRRPCRGVGGAGSGAAPDSRPPSPQSRSTPACRQPSSVVADGSSKSVCSSISRSTRVCVCSQLRANSAPSPALARSNGHPIRAAESAGCRRRRSRSTSCQYSREGDIKNADIGTMRAIANTTSRNSGGRLVSPNSRTRRPRLWRNACCIPSGSSAMRR